MIAYYDRNVQLIDWLNFFVSGIDCEGTFVYNFCIFKKIQHDELSFGCDT